MPNAWPTLPDYIEDYTQKLPWNAAGKKWGKRKPEDIKGVCFHQTDGGSKVENTNAYHIGPNHISDTGCPHICYTFHVNNDGQIKLCNPLEDVPWSQGTDKQPGSENVMLISVVAGGKFRSKDYPNLAQPSSAQMGALENIWGWLSQAFDLTMADIFGHFDFGKAGCPGSDIEAWIRRVRDDSGLLVLADVDDWQRALVKLGFDLGKSGKAKDGVDGDWGAKSRSALYQFQKQHGLPLTASFDRPTAWALRLALDGNIVTSIADGGASVG